MKKLFYKLPRHFLQCFLGFNLLWHLVAILLTYGIVVSGFDWFYFISTRNGVLNILFFPAIIIGGFLPILLPPILCGIAKLRKNARTRITALALGQAAIVSLLVSWFYKAFTGRIQPNLHDLTTDISRNFEFGFLRHGVFWGWPSSHTMVAFAMAVALFILYPKNKPLRYGAILYAFYIGLGVSLSIHWFSDFVAGAILGSVVGITVGNDFRPSTDHTPR